MGAAHAQKYADIVMDDRGNVLHAHDPDGKRFPASLTKIMSLYIIFDALNRKKITMETQFKVSVNATRVEPSILGLRPGQTITVRNIVLGMITKSANDAAVTVAEGIAGSVPKFAEMMNQTAKRLGMKSTTFYNPHGLPHPKQYTTARDFAILARALIRDFPEYYKLFKTRSFVYRGVYFPNRNHLLGKVQGVDGIKTGFFRAAGSNLAASAIRTHNGKSKRVIAVILGGQNWMVRDKRMGELIELGFRTHAFHGKIKDDSVIEQEPEIQPVQQSKDHIADLIETRDEGKANRNAVPLAGDGQSQVMWIKNTPDGYGPKVGMPKPISAKTITKKASLKKPKKLKSFPRAKPLGKKKRV